MALGIRADQEVSPGLTIDAEKFSIHCTQFGCTEAALIV
jgi:hypothetical protein